MEIERYEHGRPSWVDLSTSDLAAAAAFYGGLFGWETPPGPPEMGGYIVATLGGKTVAGIGPKMNTDVPTVWSTYVHVDDADAAAAAAKGAGGRVHVEPMDIPGSGRMAILADPAEAVVGLWQPSGHMGAQLVNEPNTWIWAMLFTTDTEGAAPFYADVFGWTAASMGEDGQIGFSVGDRLVASMMPKPAEMPAEVPPHWHVYFAVPDTDAAIARARELGGTLTYGPSPTPYGAMATILDPEGAAFSVMGTGADGA